MIFSIIFLNTLFCAALAGFALYERARVQEKQEYGRMDHPAQLELNSSRNVYVIYGRNIALRDAMRDFLDALGLRSITKATAASWLRGSPFTRDVLDIALESARAIIVLFSAEERVTLRRDLRKSAQGKERFQLQPGLDQIFEAGYALGRFPKRTILIQSGQVQLFSDIDGRYMPHFTGKEAERRDLINRLKSMECDLHIDESRWRSAGNFQLLASRRK